MPPLRSRQNRSDPPPQGEMAEPSWMRSLICTRRVALMLRMSFVPWTSAHCALCGELRGLNPGVLWIESITHYVKRDSRRRLAGLLGTAVNRA